MLYLNTKKSDFYGSEIEVSIGTEECRHVFGAFMQSAGENVADFHTILTNQIKN